MKTIITHFYNEEYLLPWWLEHHKKYFDFGVLIDYASTDNSVNIIKEICPHWQVVPSIYREFDSSLQNEEIIFYESQLTGWRIALTVTEFIVGNLNKLMHTLEGRHQWLIPGIRFTSWDPYGKLNKDEPLWNQIKTGISYYDNPIAHQCRSLHNFNDIKYEPGRHFLPNNTTEAFIFHYAHCIIGEEMVKRRLQIQNKISVNDRSQGLGTHHYYDEYGMDLVKLEQMHKEWISIGETDCSDIIKKFTVTNL